MTDEQIKKEAQRLYDAEKSKTQIQATTLRYPDMTIEQAYGVQSVWVNEKIKSGRKVIGHKIGLTSKVMQVSMQIDEPDYGVLLDDMLFENNGEIVAADFSDPRIELELAFVLSNDLYGDDLTIDDVYEATDYVVPAIELLAARSYRLDPKASYVRTVCDTIADNAANAGIIVGEKRIKPQGHDLRWIGALLYKNGEIEESGIAAAVLGHPARGLVWLAEKYFQYGKGLKKGDIILSGSFTRAIKIEKGDNIMADFNHLGKIHFKVV